MSQQTSARDGIDTDREVDALNPDPEEYHPTDNFLSKRKTVQRGIFTGDVIRACFEGDVCEIGEHTQDVVMDDEHDGYIVMLVGELAECYFGLFVNPVEKVVIEGHVLQVNPVQAAISGHWSKASIETMQGLSKEHEGKVWNSYIDPYIGNSSPWSPDDEYDDREYK